MPDIPLWYKNDRNPSMYETITVGGIAYDLTASTVAIKMRLVGSSTLKVNTAATIEASSTTLTGSHDLPARVITVASTTGFLPDGSLTVGGQIVDYTGVNGNTFTGCTGGSGTIAGGAAVAQRGGVRHDWAALDVDTAGFYLVWWEVTTSGKVKAVQEAVVEFREHAAGSTAWLCEIADVRIAMETETVDVALDAVIGQMIPVASELIMQETQRELAPATTSATRDFRVSGSNVVDLAPYDLRSATTVTLDPAGAAQVLVANQDYALMPIGGGKWSVFTDVKLATGLAVTTATGLDVVTLRVAGAWGFASVPPIAKEACVFTVRSWLRRTYPDGYGAVAEDARGSMPPLMGYAIPLAAKSMLRPLYRNIIGVF